MGGRSGSGYECELGWGGKLGWGGNSMRVISWQRKLGWRGSKLGRAGNSMRVLMQKRIYKHKGLIPDSNVKAC